jgi:hypothetical protein
MSSEYITDQEILEGELIASKPSGPKSTEPTDILKFTQSLRYEIVDDLLGVGEYRKIPADLKDLTSVLRDMDGAALTTRKLDIEETSNVDSRTVIDTFRRLRSMMNQGDDEGPAPTRQRDPLEGVRLPSVEFLEGEDASGENILNIANFVSSEG